MATFIAPPNTSNMLVNTWTNLYGSAPVSGFSGTVRIVVEVGNGAIKLSNSSTGVAAATGYGDLYDGSAKSIAFEGTLAQVNTALQSLQAYNPDANAAPTLKISAVLGGSAYNPDNEHYYRYIDYAANGIADTTWGGAKGYAEHPTTKFNGLQGYLATITTEQENQFIVGKVGGNAWIGASDEAIEGQWKWVTGPEAGTLIMTEPGDGNNAVDSSSPYYSWQTGEPNNGGGTEDYAQLISSSTGGLVAGRWNDLSNTGGNGAYTVTGFVIEYGGIGTPTEAAATSSTTLTVQATPVITSNSGGATASINYAENGIGPVATVAASDADTGDSKTYSISGGADAALFGINASTGVLTFNTSPNYEGTGDNSYEVKVRVTDSAALFDEQTLTVNVTDVNDNAPVFTSGAAGSVAENAATSTVIYDASTTDADGTAANQAVAYSLKSGQSDDAALLNINSATGAVTLKASANYEAKNSYAFTVVATNVGTGATLTTEQAVTVSVTDVNDTPAIAASGTTAFTEQTPTAVAPAITLSDDDGNWNVGTLKVEITANPDGWNDSLILPTTNPGGSGIWLDVIGSNLLMSGATQIGEASASSGSIMGGWTFTFKENATNALVQAVAQAVQFTNNSNEPSTLARTVTFTATDAAAATASATQTVTVTAVNDAPQVSNGVDQAIMVGGNVYASFADAGSSAGNLDGSIATSQAFTLETWVRFDELVGVQFIAAKGLEQMELRTNGNALRFIPTAGAYIDTGAVLVTGEWMHIATTYNAETNASEVFINGVQVTTRDNNATADDALADTAAPYLLGLRSGDASPLSGAIAEYRIWDSVRTADQIRDNRSINLQGNEANLVALWKLDEGTGTALLDSTANKFDGTLSIDVRTTRAVASGNAVTYTEDGTAVGLFSNVAVNTVESGQSITALTFTVSNVSDATETLNIDGIDIALTQGTTGTTTSNGVTYNVGVNAGTATVSLSKTTGLTPDDTATLINGITYLNSSQNPSTTNPRAVTLTSMTDNGGGSATATLSLASTVTLVAVNDAPFGTDKTISTLLEDGAHTFAAADFGFADTTDTVTGGTPAANALLAVKITTLPAKGSLTLNGVAVTAGQVVSGADIAASKLVFTPLANANGTGYTSFTFQVQDDGDTANGGVDLDPSANTLTIDVTPVNDAPVLVNATDSAPLLTSITEDDTASGGNLISSLVRAVDGTSPADTTKSVVTDIDFGTKGTGEGYDGGIAIYDLGNDGPADGGKWQYKIGSGTWTDVGAVSASSALLLASTDSIRFAPDEKNATTATISYYIWDGSSGTKGSKVSVATRGDATAFSTDGDVATITVTHLNDAPTLDLDANNSSTATGTGFTTLFRPLGQSVAIVDSDITIADVDKLDKAGTQPDTLTSAKVFIATGALNNLAATKDETLSSTAGSSFTATSGAVIAISGNGISSASPLTLTGSGTWADYQEALQTLRYQNTSESAAAGNRTISVSVTDAAITTGQEADRLESLVATSTVQVVWAPVQDLNGGLAGKGYTATYVEDSTGIAIAAPDAAINSGEKIKSLVATLKNPLDGTEGDAESLFIAADAVDELQVSGFTINGNGTHTLILSGNLDKSLYGLALQAIQYKNTSQNPSATARTVEVTVTDVTDQAGAAVTSTIGVTPVNDAPTVIALTGTTVALTTDTTSRVEIAGVTVTDVDSATHTLSVGGADAALFEVSDGKLYLKAGTQLDPTAKPSYAISLTANDGGAVNNTATQAFTINVTEAVPPAFSIAAVSGNTITLYYQDSSRLDPSKVPDASAFTVSGGYTVSTVAIPNDSSKTVVLTLNAAPMGALTVGYTAPVSNPVQDTSGNLAASLTNVAVTSATVTTSPSLTVTTTIGGLLPAPLGDFNLVNNSPDPVTVTGTTDGQSVAVSGTGNTSVENPAGNLSVANHGTGIVTVSGNLAGDTVTIAGTGTGPVAIHNTGGTAVTVASVNNGQTVTATGTGPTTINNPDGSLSVGNTGTGQVTVSGDLAGDTVTIAGTGTGPVVINNTGSTAVIVASVNAGQTITASGTGPTTISSPDGNLNLDNTGTGTVTVNGLQAGAVLNTTGAQPVLVDLSHLTAGQTITIDNDGSGVVNLMNVPEGVTVLTTGSGGTGGINYAPTISGVPGTAQGVTVGSTAALADFAVADKDSGNNLTVTLTSANGSIGGLVDADANTGGIQLTGTASAINTALVGATFTAATAGAASINISVTDAVVSSPTTAAYSLSASAPAPAPAPAPATQTIDGATVQVITTTGANGTTTTTQTVAPVTSTRQENPSTPNSALADIPLASDRTGAHTVLVSLPVGVGLTSETTGTGADATPLPLREQLINASAPRVEDAGQMQQIISDGIDQYVPTVGDQSQVTVRTITLTVAPPAAGGALTPPATPIVIRGASGTGESDPANPLRGEALVIDARNLPPGTVLDLSMVEFAIIVGPATATGGSGRNYVIGDASDQFMVLGADDDILHGGGGNDTVGSKGGHDQLFGDDGNDWVVGGIGNDTLDGGSGNDVLVGGMSDAGTWSFQLNAQGEIVTSFAVKESALTDTPTFSHIGPWWTGNGSGIDSDDRLAFSYQSPERLKAVALLYKAAIGTLPTLNELNAYGASKMSQAELATLAVSHYLANQGPTGQNMEVQLKGLIEAVWGVSTATDALVALGVSHISQGGTWADALLYLVNDVKAAASVTDAAGNLSLTQTWVTRDIGFMSDAGDNVLRGGAGNDRLVGGKGNNTLDGGDGMDLAVFTGAATDFTFHLQAVNGVVQTVATNKHTGAVNTLIGVELLEIGSKYYGTDVQKLPALGVETELSSVLVEYTEAQVQLIGVSLV